MHPNVGKCNVAGAASAFLLLVVTAPALSQDRDAQPRVVTPAQEAGHPPSDAVVLFDGSALDQWRGPNGGPARCEIRDAALHCESGSGDIHTTEQFRHAQIHLEFGIPSMPDQKGQLRGNSGFYLQGRYELQILDSYQNETYGHGHLGGLYSQAAPLVNAARPPGQWQFYDVIFRGPECDSDGNVTRKATVTALVNGLLVQDHVPIDASEKLGKGCAPGPILLQDHSGFPNAPHTVMRFRNVWLRHLDRLDPTTSNRRTVK
jgi:hypothetical protein